MVCQKDLTMNIAKEIRWFQSPGIFREDSNTSSPLNKSTHDTISSHNTDQSLLPRHKHIYNKEQQREGREGAEYKYMFNKNFRTLQ